MASAVANRWRSIAGKCLVFGLALLPLGFLVVDIVNANLGPDPGQVITEALGIAAFQLLLVTLAITPLKKVTGWSGWLRYRRMLGLFAFFYAALHLLAFLQLILGWMDLWATFTKRPYIIAGAAAFLAMVPLAITSTRRMMKRTGRWWKPLHRLIYPAAILAWVHFLWQARSDITEMVVYAVILAGLLVVRARWFGVSSLVPLKRT
ncbi:sulfoxide reductase heme-binding subunit YedZ [Marinobacter sp. G11]|uniref:sulfite oxidase heme-binding subunit YedZ n=1 Tax=Marinobacter sp. G11 TaxID=2903522 RepID=UPI001E2D6D45|nr:protein-methionine-sulfoxide reductase heme-binding subunit MsrQ [Marinobacter sp. G11]MCE0758798.1 sulfoxide reductase heme-binding subunit YedZ [Marinobacter sp. G11]